MFKVFIMGLAVGLALLLIISTGALRTQQKNEEQIKYQTELVDATPVHTGALTEKQRIHSKCFTMYLDR